MTTISLPLIGEQRSEFGYPRTNCACPDCTECCRHVPGFLVPADLNRLHQHQAPDADLFDWARQHLLASPGALVARADQQFRIPTLVPARQPNGACIFLTEEGLCRVHAMSPFGCAFFDTHMPSGEATARSTAGLRSVLDAWTSMDSYAEIWEDLAREGRRAPAPEEGWARLHRTSHNRASPSAGGGS